MKQDETLAKIHQLILSGSASNIELALQIGSSQGYSKQDLLTPWEDFIQFFVEKEDSLSQALTKLVQAEHLNLLSKNISVVYPSIDNLPNLREINLNVNQLETLPKELSNLKQLKILRLNSNQFRSLPEYIGNLIHLEQLWLANNQLENIPNCVYKLENLELLTLEYNQLDQVEDDIQQLQKLRRLDLYQNKGFSRTQQRRLKTLLPNCTIRFVYD